MTHHVLKVATDAGKDHVHDVMSARLVDRHWNRGDSGMQLAWYVSARGRPSVKVWRFEDEPGTVYIDFRDDAPDDVSAGEVDAWKRAHLRRVVEAGLVLGQPVSASDEVLPILAELGHDSVDLERTAPGREA